MIEFNHKFCLLFCWVISVLVGWSSTSGQMMAADFFPGVKQGERRDLSNITWAHAVNSKQKLQDALKGNVSMLEADILIGEKGNSGFIPIMAHPPSTTSDLSFDDFLSEVLRVQREDHRKVGIKLDFKQIDAVKPVLKKLQEKGNELTFPIFLNADILRGPVQSVHFPLDGRQFLKQTKKYLPKATLSLGWTTRFGSDDIPSGSRKKYSVIKKGQYTKEQMDEMAALWDELQLDGTPVTFPVRAGIAVQSVDILVNFLFRIGSQSTFTLWSPMDDPVNMTQLQFFLDTVGSDKVYIDLPFPIDTGAAGVPTPSDVVQPDEHNHDSPDAVKPNEGSDTTTGNILCLTTSVLLTYFSQLYF